MNEINIAKEFQSELKRLRNERDLYRLIAIDEVQFNRSIAREEASSKVDREVFQQLQGVPL